MTTLTDLATEAAFEAHLASQAAETLHVISFHAPWAAPCAQMRTLLTTLAATYPAGSAISFAALDAEELPEVSERYDVTAVPFLVLQRGAAGPVLESISGCDAARIRAAVERHFGAAGGGAAQNQAALPPAPESDPAAVARAKEAARGAQAGGEEAQAPAVSQEELHARLEALVKAAPVMLFMKGTPSAPQCGFSRQVVAMLRDKGVRYGFFNILADEDVRQGLKDWADWPTFPQLWVGGELVGGLDIVKEEVENNPDFFADYSVGPAKDSALAPETQQQTAAVA